MPDKKNINKNLYTERNVHPNAIRGALASIAIDYSIPK